MTPTPEKAAPIPADGLAFGDAVTNIATNKARTALAGFTSVEDAAFALDVTIGDIADWKRRAALSTQESSAALAGDGKEVGR